MSPQPSHFTIFLLIVPTTSWNRVLGTFFSGSQVMFFTWAMLLTAADQNVRYSSVCYVSQALLVCRHVVIIFFSEKLKFLNFELKHYIPLPPYKKNFLLKLSACLNHQRVDSCSWNPKNTASNLGCWYNKWIVNHDDLWCQSYLNTKINKTDSKHQVQTLLTYDVSLISILKIMWQFWSRTAMNWEDAWYPILAAATYCRGHPRNLWKCSYRWRLTFSGSCG